ncbi:metallophosphoesterase [Ornithinibacillus halotolerans]|uniref:Metallophosphoesterase YkuE n=1 Tax=Ornithinibacillus halotolerans TaxID=1274357 RepID=A0A916S9X1_9BACI|nr:metallophosphoesterase [Ornithinibacillus halotolerans]GGA87835.1 putative metallophosphoesterase YkuE [Ornithinibacillus halotolerans]
MNRRSFLKKLIGSTFILLGVSGGTYYYARNIEPSLLTTKEEVITSSKIPTSFDGFKIVQFSDTHLGFHYNLDQFKELVNKINHLSPDLVVFTGDLVDDPNNYEWNSRIIELLQSLNATKGKYWIYGNHDHGGYGTEIVYDVMNQAQFKLLQNNHDVIQINADRIILAGIDDVILGKPNLSEAIKNTNPDLFTILLAHEPDFADTTLQFPVDVQLSGHSHGGQVRLPFIGHLYTPIYAEKYVEGKYTFSKSNLELFVSRGIGTTRLPYRFLCKPEITLFTLKRS